MHAHAEFKLFFFGHFSFIGLIYLIRHNILRETKNGAQTHNLWLEIQYVYQWIYHT